MSGECRGRVVVCVCTHRRPGALAHLLDRLGEVAHAARDVARVGVVVVDDDGSAVSAREVADAVAQRSSRFELGIELRVTGADDLSVARAAALAGGVEMGEYIALIDDDCLPEIDWLRELVSVQRLTDAELVVGWCEDVAPPGAPSWLADDGFLSQGPSDLEDGEATTEGYLKNALLSSAALVRDGIGFEPSLGRVGGEDVVFFRACRDAGFRQVAAPGAVVREVLPPERATLRYQLRRALWYGNTEAVTDLVTGDASRTRIVMRGGRSFARGPIEAVVALAQFRRLRWRAGLAELFRGIGLIIGAVGIRLRHR